MDSDPEGAMDSDSDTEGAPDRNLTGRPAPPPPRARPGEERRNPGCPTRDEPDSGSVQPLRGPNPRFPGQFPRGPAAPGAPSAPLLGDRYPAQRNPSGSGDTGAPAVVVPWVQRRKVAAGDAHGRRAGKTAAPQGTLRTPTGPDGTAGFLRGGRGRGRPPPAGPVVQRLLPGVPPADPLEQKNAAGT